MNSFEFIDRDYTGVQSTSSTIEILPTTQRAASKGEAGQLDDENSN